VNDFTVTVAVDFEHAEELLEVLPTWERNKPSLFLRPWVLMISSDVGVRLIDITHVLSGFGVVPMMFRIPGKWGEDHRSRMLNSFLQISPHITTRHYLKIDTDCVAIGIDSWFRGMLDDDAVMTAPAWSYTKPAYYLDHLDSWSDQIPCMQNLPRPLREVYDETARSSRVTSYWSFIQTAFARSLAAICPLLPVPSQDTTMWYAANRMQAPIHRFHGNSGWLHCGSDPKRITSAVEKAMR